MNVVTDSMSETPVEGYPLGLLMAVCRSSPSSDSSSPVIGQNPPSSLPQSQRIYDAVATLIEQNRILFEYVSDLQSRCIQMAKGQVEQLQTYQQVLTVMRVENQKLREEMAEYQLHAQAREAALMERIKNVETNSQAFFFSAVQGQR